MMITSMSRSCQLQVTKLCEGSERGRNRKRTERESQEIAREPGIWRTPQAQLDPKPRASYQGCQLLHLTSLCLFFLNHFIYLFLAVPGFRCCMGLSLVSVSGGHSLPDDTQPSRYSGFFCCRAPVSRLCGLSSCGPRGSRAQARSVVMAQGVSCILAVWGVPRARDITHGLFTTEPPGKP